MKKSIPNMSMIPTQKGSKNMKKDNHVFEVPPLEFGAYHCPTCHSSGMRRSGVHFEHEFICTGQKCWEVWEPDKRDDLLLYIVGGKPTYGNSFDAYALRIPVKSRVQITRRNGDVLHGILVTKSRDRISGEINFDIKLEVNGDLFVYALSSEDMIEQVEDKE